MKIFGREPTAWIQAFSALLAVVVGFGLDFLSAEQAALLTAVFAGALNLVNALAVRPVAPAVFTGLITAGAALLTGYGLDLSQEMIGSVVAATTAVMALLTRAQVSPPETARLTGVLGNKVTTEGFPPA